MSYKILDASSIKELEILVSKKMKDGWTPCGGVFALMVNPTVLYYYQSVTKEDVPVSIVPNR